MGVGIKLPANVDDDPVLGSDGYPHDIEVQRIISWRIRNRDDVLALVAYVKRRWTYADVGYWTEVVDRDGTVHLMMSTGGWSGNEDLVDALESSIAWGLCFDSHRRGGHYVLVVPTTLR